MTAISVVIPVYNSEGTLHELVGSLTRTLSVLCDDFEIILVNDASRDRSWQTITELSQNNQWVRGINLSRNYGQHNAILCGIRRARFHLIATMDDDLQHPPDQLPKLLEALLPDIDVVYGTPIEEKSTLWRTWASRLIKFAIKRGMGIPTAVDVSAFRLFRAPICTSFKRYRSSYVSIDVLLTWGTTRFASVKVRHEARRVGKSNYTVAKLIAHAVNMMTGFSTLPLQIASVIGFSLTGLGLILLLYVFGRYLIEGGSIPGFPFLASALSLFSGAQLFALGVIGEYIARIHFRLLGRPPYLVNSQTPNFEGENNDGNEGK